MSKLIVVTGGTRGIGRAILEKFLEQGFDAVTCSRDPRALEALQKDTTGHRSNVFVKMADLSDKNQANAFADYVLSLNRPIDVLVNNAGHFVSDQLTAVPDDALEKVMAANVYSAHYLTRGIIASLKAQKRGHIFNVCSVASLKAYPHGGSYTVSKFALLGFSKVLREELKEFGIRVTAIMPGATRTASWDGTDLPEDRFMSVLDVADTVYASYAISGRSVVEEIVIRPMLGDI
jgi:NAD(P)-dependent dehydrogenase (short-subunit alcohol dehydrogenase family)